MKITINGQEYNIEGGKSILQVCQELGIYIPALCYYENEKPTGSCGLCIVSLKNPRGKKTYVRACATPVREGMVIETSTPEIEDARKTILEMILAEHPPECMTCEANGECTLQELAYRYGISKPSFTAEIKGFVKDDNPFFIRDNAKCVKCWKCITACRDVKLKKVLGVKGRGHNVEIIAGTDESLIDAGCAFCGACIDACPTGALFEKSRVGKGRVWEMQKITSVCPYCGVGCMLDFYVKDGKIVYVRGSKEGINKGDDCIKGRFGWEFVHSKERLTKPLIKINGKFREVSWDEALDYIAKRFREIKDKYGADSIGGFSSAKCTNEENYLFQKFMRTVIGTNNVDHCARLCHSSTVTGLIKTLGSGAMTNSIDDLERADVFLVIGSNTTEAHPVIATRIKRAVMKGAKLIVVDPRRIGLARFATMYLRPKPGTDVALINAFINVILDLDLVDWDFVKSRTEGFEKLKKVVEKYTPEYAEKITGVNAHDIVKAAVMYGKAKRAAIIYAMGMTQHISGTANVATLANLALVTGNVGKEGSGVNPLRGQNNVQGACDLGALPNLLPGYKKVMDLSAHEHFMHHWGVDVPYKPGLTIVEMINAAYDGKLKALYIMGENPVLSDPDQKHVIEALNRIEFLVVQDIFLTETAQYADVVLPAASFAEKEGTFTNTERRVQLLNKIVEPPGEAKPDWWIITELARRMGHEWNYACPEDIFNEIRKVVVQYAGMTYERLRHGGLQWPCPDEKHPGTPILHQKIFPRYNGLARFVPYEYIPPAESPDDEFPYIMITGRMYEHFHTGTMTRRVEGLNHIAPEPCVEISPEDAKKIGVNEEDYVYIESRRGKVKARVKIADIEQGCVFLPFHFAEGPANRLTSGENLDPEAKIPEFKVSAVKIWRCET